MKYHMMTFQMHFFLLSSAVGLSILLKDASSFLAPMGLGMWVGTLAISLFVASKRARVLQPLSPTTSTTDTPDSESDSTPKPTWSVMGITLALVAVAVAINPEAFSFWREFHERDAWLAIFAAGIAIYTGWWVWRAMALMPGNLQVKAGIVFRGLSLVLFGFLILTMLAALQVSLSTYLPVALASLLGFGVLQRIVNIRVSRRVLAGSINEDG